MVAVSRTRKLASGADNRLVTGEIRRVVWPVLKEAGFESFTGRNAWRYFRDDVDLVSFHSFGGMNADSLGCTSYSFQVGLGLWRPSDALTTPRERDPQGKLRPRDYECEPHRIFLRKSLDQPWFRAFEADASSWPSSFRTHREALKHVFGAKKHDNEYVWFVLSDGSNLRECVEDALDAILREGLPWFDSLRR